MGYRQQRPPPIFRSALLALTLLLATAGSLPAQTILAGDRSLPVEAENGMVVTSHPLASQVALQVLQQGGNAIDAAVSAGFALAVTQPRSGNLGGGGFMLIALAKRQEVVAIDYREQAPAAASRDMFLGPDGQVDSSLSRFSHLSAGVPGTVAGLTLALERYGSISLVEALAPAIELAAEGFPLPPRFVKGIRAKQQLLLNSVAGRKKFLKADGSSYRAGERFVQPELAGTLQRIAEQGPWGFYEGETADLIVAEMRRGKGLISHQDLKGYRARIRRPVRGSYRGVEIYSMSPPSSGGIHLIQILNILEGFPIGELGHNSARSIHLMAEAMKRAYADRSRYLGDSDFVKVPLAGLSSKSYAATLRAGIDPQRATDSRKILPGDPAPYESDEATHFSIVDRFGNAVANTYSLNFSYGSGIVVAGAGFLLNNQMDDFSAKPGVPNAYGLLGGQANRIEPHKRMLSSMSPSILKKDGRNVLVLGSPGGSRIITTSLQLIMNVIDHKLNIQAAVNAPRIHHQWLPDEIRIEQGISPDTVRLLRGMGHRVVHKRAMGALQGIMTGEDGMLYGGPIRGGAPPLRWAIEAADSQPGFTQA